jgi:hypothetical protein
MRHKRGGQAPGHIREAFDRAADAYVEWDGSGPSLEVEV